MAIELNINCNRKNAEVIFLTLLNYADYEELLNLISKASQNVYKEYIYTGDTSQTYDASKWGSLENIKLM